MCSFGDYDIDGKTFCKSHSPIEHGRCCSICLDDCPIGTKPTKCGHIFHSSCMNKWKRQDGGHTCPMCRTVLSKPKVLSHVDILNRVTVIAQESDDADMFIENLARTMNHNELEYIMSLIRSF